MSSLIQYDISYIYGTWVINESAFLFYSQEVGLMHFYSFIHPVSYFLAYLQEINSFFLLYSTPPPGAE